MTDWNRLVAGRAASLKPSPFVDLEPIWSVDDLIFFAGGTPPPERIPIRELQREVHMAWDAAEEIYAYGDGQGYLPLRQLIARRMAARNTHVTPANILITNGSQQGLDLIGRTLFEPGDLIIVEGPTYFGALQAFDAYQVEYLVAPVDDHGLDVDEVERLLRQHQHIKAIYSVSIFQNPSGVTLSGDRRSRLLKLAREHNVAVIEDDPYGELAFDAAPRPPLRALDENVIYLGTFSKTLLPALRIGWMIFPDALKPPLLDSKEAVDIQSDRFVQRAIVGVSQSAWLDAHLNCCRAIYRQRCQHMLSALERELPDGTSWNEPDGGFFLWVNLPAELSADELLPVAAQQRVGFLPGSFFFPDRRKVASLRLGFSTLPEARIDEGIRRLGEAIRVATSSR